MRVQINIEELKQARCIVAELAAANPLLTPVFERLDKEYNMLAGSRETAIQRIARQRREIRDLA
ncbi:hypothetical protein [Agrobacterium vitis]|uniref:hypothetical protein n=1 Tax=Agrobacterium vitis TaxID=373 RepID=UPI0015728DAD|nr:hypothetical protein [Agrobacterium vitis]NSZ17560.1 hypothetical protein [Agrobacterium vitis]QZO03254.1 hypothetical protein K4831_12500 [Agrobacterium vitis]UJL88374.1 hypothetical protein AVF2S5_10840 [Agrobacterium vitis]